VCNIFIKEAILLSGGEMKLNFNKKLGLRIRELRLSRSMKQGELADALNMERSNLTRIESGKQRPNYENLEKLAEILNVEIKELFDFEHKKTKEELITSIINILNDLNEKEIEFCYKSINNLKQMK